MYQKKEREERNMTRLYYTVGSETFTSYSQAVARSKSLGFKLVSHYEPIHETTQLTEQQLRMREKRLVKIRERKAARA